MTRPRVHPRFFALIAFVAILGASYAAQAEQPPAVSPPPAQAKPAAPPRSKPQIIYRLPRNSNYAATLHSQSKIQSHPLPIDNSRAPSLQLSREAANEAAARERQQQPQQQRQQQTAPKANSSRPQRIKPSKFHANKPQLRKHGPGKGRGPGSSRGKGRKK
jgi:hypothetical protein